MFPLNDEELEIHFLLKELEDHKRNADKSMWMHGTVTMWQGAQNRYDIEKTKYLEKANAYMAKQYKEANELYNKHSDEI